MTLKKGDSYNQSVNLNNIESNEILKVTGRTRLFGIIGHPVSHSLSPIMQNRAFEALKLDCLYLPLDVAPNQLKTVLRGLGVLGFHGFNVTIPHKQSIVKSLHRLSREARLIGAVNTIQIHQGKWIGHNTDGRGFVQAYQAEIGQSFCGKRVLLLGAGGAARAVATQLLIEKVGCLLISNRTAVRAQSLKRFLKMNFRNRKIENVLLKKNDLVHIRDKVDVIVNATSVGMIKKDKSPVPPGVIRPNHIVCDLVYQPSVTALSRESREVGAKVMNGVGMLLYQGALAFKIWTGKPPPLKAMRAALLEVLAESQK